MIGLDRKPTMVTLSTINIMAKAPFVLSEMELKTCTFTTANGLRATATVLVRR